MEICISVFRVDFVVNAPSEQEARARMNYGGSWVRVNFIMNAVSEQKARAKLNASLRPLVDQPLPAMVNPADFRPGVGRRVRFMHTDDLLLDKANDHKVSVAIMFDDDNPMDEDPPVWLLAIVTSRFDEAVQFVDISKKAPILGS